MRLLTKAAAASALFISAAAWCVPQMANATVSAPTSPPIGIDGFNDPGGFTLNGQTGVPAINGTLLDLTTADYSENSTAFYNTKQDISHFYASFVYTYGGTASGSLGTGNGFTFLIQNDSRGLNADGASGFANGQEGQGGTITPSVAVEFNTFTGFSQAVGTQLAVDGDYGPFQNGSNSYFVSPGSVNILSGDPIQVVLTYNGVTLSETLTDLITHSTWSTGYSVNIVNDVDANSSSPLAYVGFSGGTGAAVSNQTISNFVYNNSVPSTTIVTGPVIKLTATGAQSGSTAVVAATLTNSGSTVDNFVITNATFSSSPIAPGQLPTIPDMITSAVPQTSDLTFNYSTPSTVPSSGTLFITATYTYFNGTSMVPGAYSATLRNVTIQKPVAE